MKLDNQKFVALLAENSGIEKEKVELYLKELIEEIRTAVDEGEAYEIDDFGIFSKLGNNILFIPSESLETEVNYKYVGMEALVLPGSATEATETEEDQIEGVLDEEIEDDIFENSKEESVKSSETKEYEDPFAELFDESDDNNDDYIDEEEIEAAVEEEIENETVEDIFNEISGEENEDDDEVEPTAETANETELENHAFDDDIEDIFDEEFDEEESELEKDIIPGPETWGIDAHKEENQENAFSGLLGDDVTESTSGLDEDPFGQQDNEDDLEDVFGDDENEDGDEIDFSALETSEDDSLSNEEKEEELDFVPVVTNVSSGKAKKSEPVKKEEPAIEDIEKSVEKALNRKMPSDRNQTSPVVLYVVLALVVLGGTGYLLAFFGVINIQGITPQDNRSQVTQATPPSVAVVPAQKEANLPEMETVPEVGETGSNSVQNSEVANENAQTNNREGLAPLVADEKAPGGEDRMSTDDSITKAEAYGLRGVVNPAGNNGYTIVLYTLSRKAGADEQLKKLTEQGYRVLIKEKPSDTYGILYRVSIGQFKTLADAAVAAEDVDKKILGNYIITKI